MLSYALKALAARKAQATVIVIGFALSFATVIFSYAVASNFQIASSQALSFVVRDSALWMMPQGAPVIDPGTQSLVQDGFLDPALIRDILSDSQIEPRLIAVEHRAVSGLRVTVYRDSAFKGTATVSRGLIDALPDKDAAIDNVILREATVSDALPGRSLVLPAHNNELRSRWTWVLLDREDTAGWAREFSSDHDLALVDTLAGSAGRSERAKIVLLTTTLSRFDPFSFETKFAALQLNAVTSSLLGWLARIVFLFGAVLVITSSRISVAERRAEVAALTILGYQADFTILLLIENAVLLLISLPIALVIGLTLSFHVLPLGNLASSFAASAGLTIFFLPIVLIVAALWSGQYIASKSEISLVRSDF
jgi:hypothetical protein